MEPAPAEAGGAGSLHEVTVWGAGVQGSMLAFRCAVHGKHVALFDIDAAALQTAQAKIEGWLGQRERDGRLSKKEAAAARRRLVACQDAAAALAAADLVIENVPERIELKQAVWAEIDRLAPAKTLLTTNSSSLRSSEIGAGVNRRDQTFNVNFMTPTEDDLVEVMWNDATSESTRRAALAFLTSIRCVPIVTRREIKGFSLNRVWRAMKKECLMLWSQGYVDPHDLDRAFMLEWKTTWGPFGLMDRVGLDVIRDIELSYHRESGDESDLPPRALQEMIAAGHLGEKSGSGFYEYPGPAYERPGWLQGHDAGAVNDAQA
jgi:3-hydroxybutyryl-CoA dehydrogenase